jgi:hypothetical protein
MFMSGMRVRTAGHLPNRKTGKWQVTWQEYNVINNVILCADLSRPSEAFAERERFTGELRFPTISRLVPEDVGHAAGRVQETPFVQPAAHPHDA